MKHEWQILIGLMIKHARYLNGYSDISVSHTPGTDYLYGMLVDKVITNSMYQQMKRLAEDPKMEYEIIIQ